MKKEKVLIVDDEWNMRQLLTIHLSTHFEIKEAGSGMEALELLRKETVNLVILDLMMPDLDGWEVCKRIRETNQVPILMLTARGDIKDKVSGFAVGADDYLVKPFIPEELIVRSMALIRRSTISNDTIHLYQSAEMIKNSIILAGTGAIFLAIGFTFIVSRKLSNPLLEMEKATRLIAKGDLNTRVSRKIKDEIGSLANAINDLAFELQRYRSSRREFFANISHELRTPITYLEGYANVVENKKYKTEEEKNLYLQIIQQEAKRMSSLVNDLFELSKLEEGKLHLHFEAIDLIEVIDNVVTKTKMKAQKKNLELSFTRLYKLPTIYADGLRMEQILINLIENAIRYTERGLITINLSHDSNKIIISVEDTGIGIPNKDIPYLFERFYRVEKSRSREYGGSGLGLAIVKQLVELQNGKIQVKSEFGKGTCFIMEFPIHKGDQR